MPDETNVKRIVDRLLDRTLSGRQEWQASDYGRTPSFETHVGDWPVVVYSVDGDERHPLRFAILNLNEEEIEALQTQDPQGVPAGDERERRANSNRSLFHMYQAAKRNALGVDRAISEIEEILDA